jgi:hypothetical protein
VSRFRILARVGKGLTPLTLVRLELVWVVAVIVAALTGLAIVRGQLLLGVIPIMLLLGLVLVSSLSISGWCVLLLILTIVMRAVVETLHLPPAMTFLHYPAVLAFAYVASHPRHADGTRVPASRWIGGLLGIVVLSSIINLTNPLRILLFLIIVGEPLLVIWAIQRWGMTAESERRIMRAFGWLLAVQIPIGVWQGLTVGWMDPVKGTLMGSGAGSHTIAALFALGLFVWLAAIQDGRRPIWTAPVVAALAFGMMAAGGAVTVIIFSGAALPVILFVRRGPKAEGRVGRRVSRTRSWLASRRRAARFALAMVVILGAVLAPFVAARIVPNIVERIDAIANLKNFPEFTLPLERAGVPIGGLDLEREQSVLQALLGSGPGTSSSRAALLPVPGYTTLGAAFGTLNIPLEPTRLAVKIAHTSSRPYGGSVEAASSEILGVIGDLGITGFVGLILLFIGVVRAARKSDNWLAPALVAALVMTFLLCFIDNWLEYPEYAVPLAVLIGVATSRRPDAVTVGGRWDRDRLGHREESRADTART